MTPTRCLILACALVALAARPARADATIFLGADVTPSNRATKGLAVEAGFLVVGFEFEYAQTSEDTAERAPSLKTGMANLLLQTPLPVLGLQPYVTAGVGLYHEELGIHDDTGLGLNTGGGVKIGLVGPLRLRLDYRVFSLGSGALTSPAHRLYAGLNLAF
jgi:opacity protein-like surface antigen